MSKKSTKKELRRDIRVFNKIKHGRGPTTALQAIAKHYSKHIWLSKEEKAEWGDMLLEVDKIVVKFLKKNIKDREMRIEENGIRGTSYLKD